MIRPVLRYGEPVLHRPADSVGETGDAVAELVDDLIATVHAVPGIGLAAPQIGVSRRVFVIDLSLGARPGDLLVMINPAFVSRHGLQLEEEGCLSVPGFQATVARPASLTLQGLDRAGRPQTVTAEGLLARAIQHEVDHLDGILFIDRLRPLQRRLIVRRIDAMRRCGKW